MKIPAGKKGKTKQDWKGKGEKEEGVECPYEVRKRGWKTSKRPVKKTEGGEDFHDPPAFWPFHMFTLGPFCPCPPCLTQVASA